MIKIQNKIKNYLKEIKEEKKTSQLLKYISDKHTLLVIRFMADLLRKYRGSVVIMVGRGGAEPHYVHN